MHEIRVDGDGFAVLTTADAAAILRVCHTTVRNRADAGDLPYVLTDGGHRRFRVADVVALAERRGAAARMPLDQLTAAIRGDGPERITDTQCRDALIYLLGYSRGDDNSGRAVRAALGWAIESLAMPGEGR